MKSIQSLALRKIGKRGQTLEIIGGTIIGFMVLIFMVFAVLFGIAALKPSTFFTGGTAGDNSSAAAVTNLQQNLSGGVGAFAAYIPTILTILGVVLVIAGVVILVLYVRRMQGSSGVGMTSI